MIEEKGWVTPDWLRELLPGEAKNLKMVREKPKNLQESTPQLASDTIELPVQYQVIQQHTSPEPVHTQPIQTATKPAQDFIFVDKRKLDGLSKNYLRDETVFRVFFNEKYEAISVRD